MADQEIISPDVGSRAKELARRLLGGESGTDLLFDVAAFINLPNGADITALSELLEAIDGGADRLREKLQSVRNSVEQIEGGSVLASIIDDE